MPNWTDDNGVSHFNHIREQEVRDAFEIVKQNADLLLDLGLLSCNFTMRQTLAECKNQEERDRVWINCSFMREGKP